MVGEHLRILPAFLPVEVQFSQSFHFRRVGVLAVHVFEPGLIEMHRLGFLQERSAIGQRSGFQSVESLNVALLG